MSEDPECKHLKAIQLVQNKMLRALNRTNIKDKVSTDSLLKKFNITSVNRLNAQVKLLEVWKSQNLDKYPLEIKKQTPSDSGVTTRAATKGKLIEVGRSITTKNTSISDAIRVWNLAPESVTESTSLCQVKNAIKAYVNLLPI